MREVKLAATLKRLVDKGEYRGNRKMVCAELGITQAALSQYIRGQTTPTPDKLVAIADLFKVSLDFLMFGEDEVAGPSGVLDYGPLGRFVEGSFDSVRADMAAQSALVAKIGTILADQIGTAARSAAKRPATLPGMLDKEQALELERFSEVSTMLTMDLNDDVDIVKVRGDIEQGVTAGNFLTVVAENLLKSRCYHFILSPEMPDRDLVIQQYRQLLLRQELSDEDLERCTFSTALDTFYVGFALYQLDVDSLRQDSPILFQVVRDYIGSDGRIGFIESPAAPVQAYFLMDAEHLRLASRALDRLTPDSGLSA